MDYLTDTDQVIFLAGGVGLAIGLVTSAQDIAIKKWTEQEWLGWDWAISRSVVSAIVWALLTSAAVFVSILYEPAKSLATIQKETLILCVGIGLLLPVLTRVSQWALEQVSKLIKPNEN